MYGGVGSMLALFGLTKWVDLHRCKNMVVGVLPKPCGFGGAPHKPVGDGSGEGRSAALPPQEDSVVIYLNLVEFD